jgi:hypothetical protein
VREERSPPTEPPPKILDSEVVLSWARIDDSVRFTGRLHHFVDGQRLGAVPCLAIVQGSTSDELFVHHCDAAWRTLATTPGGRSLDAAKLAVERWYDGAGHLWVDTGTTPAQAAELLQEHWSPFVCSFCGKDPTQILSLIQAPTARICNECVLSFHQWLVTEP